MSWMTNVYLSEVAINGLNPQVIGQKVVSVFERKTLKSLGKALARPTSSGIVTTIYFYGELLK
jgi:hypothetical protein